MQHVGLLHCECGLLYNKIQDMILNVNASFIMFKPNKYVKSRCTIYGTCSMMILHSIGNVCLWLHYARQWLLRALAEMGDGCGCTGESNAFIGMDCVPVALVLDVALDFVASKQNYSLWLCLRYRPLFLWDNSATTWAPYWINFYLLHFIFWISFHKKHSHP